MPFSSLLKSPALYITILSIVFFFGCTKYRDDPKVPYYQFTNTTKDWFTDAKQNDTVKFMSNTGKIRTYVVAEAVQKKEEYADYSWTFGTKTLYFNYDQWTVSFSRVDSLGKGLKIQIYAFGPDTANPRKPLPSDKGIIRSFFTFEDYIGKPIGANFNILTDFTTPINFISFSMGSRTFNDVIEYSCGCSTPFYDTGWSRWNTVNKIRYSKTKGFLNFEMTTGETWNRQF